MPIGEGIHVSYPFKWKGGDSAGEENPDPSSQGGLAKGILRGDAQGVKHHAQVPFLIPIPIYQWYGIENMGKVRG